MTAARRKGKTRNAATPRAPRQQSSNTQQPGGVSVAAVAAMCHLTPRRVQQLVNEGVIPRADRGRYNLAASVRAYIMYLQQRLEQAHADAVRPAAEALAAERLLRERVQREREQLRFAQERGTLVDVAVAARETEQYQERVRAVLFAARSKYADLVSPTVIKTIVAGMFSDLQRDAARFAEETAPSDAAA